MQGLMLPRRAVVGLVVGAAVSACASIGRPRPVALEDVIRRNTRARGGDRALDAMRSLAVDVEIVEGGNVLTCHYAASKDGFVRIDVYGGGKNVFSEGVDEQGGWQWTGGSDPAKPGSDKGRAALLNGAENHLFGWDRFRQRGHQIALMPAALIDGVTYQVVEVRFATGQISYFYVDPESWQAVRRRDDRAYHPDVNPTTQKVETRFFDFQAAAGVIEPHSATDVDLATGKTLAKNRTLRRIVNPQLSTDYFERTRRALASWT